MRTAIHRLPGLVTIDHELRVPLDHDRPDGDKITIFGREVVATRKADSTLPWIVFLQGGPGFASPRPESRSGWLERACEDYRVFFLDQRGTGRSSPVNHQSLARFGTPVEQADYLGHFRTDAIVRDAELFRRELLGDEPWIALGQSFGGFCITSYLSLAPQGLSGALVTGGLPPLEGSADDVYRATYVRVVERNRRYFDQFAGDVEIVAEIAREIAAGRAILPDGTPLTLRRFQQLGMGLGMSYGAARLHYLLEGAFIDGARGRELSYTFLHGVESQQPFQTNPIYALLHEAIYCQGEASRWSAERVRAEFPMFDDQGAVAFTGEMVYPWMFEDYAHLRPMRAAAEILAERTDWPRLYDAEQLAKNTVPCAAAIYADDMYVERQFSEQTAATIKGMRTWLTDEHQHDGLRSAGKDIVSRLLDLMVGEA